MRSIYVCVCVFVCMQAYVNSCFKLINQSRGNFSPGTVVAFPTAQLPQVHLNLSWPNGSLLLGGWRATRWPGPLPQATSTSATDTSHHQFVGKLSSGSKFFASWQFYSKLLCSKKFGGKFKQNKNV